MDSEIVRMLLDQDPDIVSPCAKVDDRASPNIVQPHIPNSHRIHWPPYRTSTISLFPLYHTSDVAGLSHTLNTVSPFQHNPPSTLVEQLFLSIPPTGYLHSPHQQNPPPFFFIFSSSSFSFSAKTLEVLQSKLRVHGLRASHRHLTEEPPAHYRSSISQLSTLYSIPGCVPRKPQEQVGQKQMKQEQVRHPNWSRLEYTFSYS